LTMLAGENQLNPAFLDSFHRCLDMVEGSTGPAALVTTSSSPKFFCNGADVKFLESVKADQSASDGFDRSMMRMLGRILSLPLPTVACVTGHAFGAGFMLALAHDFRAARLDRGYLCANEVLIGMGVHIPPLRLFECKMSKPAFQETVLSGRRWDGKAGVQAGFLHAAVPEAELLPWALETAKKQVKLGAARDLNGWMKQQVFGREIDLLLHPDLGIHLAPAFPRARV